jgi:hypothetical protein
VSGRRRVRAARAALVLAGLAGAAGTATAEVGRYKFSCRADQGTFVLDTQTGRVWRFDRVDDAWYLYDLEALVPRTKGRRSEKPSEADDDDETRDR